jgi:DNA-directed RNA polymerase subunit RPC12/RpoP
VIQLYVDEAGGLVALEEFEPSRETWRFAQALPSIPEHYRCCSCGRGFREHPGAAIQCPACSSLYVLRISLTDLLSDR